MVLLHLHLGNMLPTLPVSFFCRICCALPRVGPNATTNANIVTKKQQRIILAIGFPPSMLIKDEARRPVTNIVSLHSELIVLRDDSPEIGKSKHHVEHDQQTDCAKDCDGC